MRTKNPENSSYKMPAIKIRAHHLLCMQGFQGYGYSQEFVDKLRDVIETIDLHPDVLLKIVNYCDDICSHCPHNIDGVCRKDPDSGYKILEMDMLVLEKLGLSEGEIRRAGNLLHHVNEVLESFSDVQDICGCCTWRKKCRWFTSRENNP